MKTITNIAEVMDKAREIITEAVKSCDTYQTDIYLYVDEDGTATVEDFYNVGGSSWLDDDHITLCKIPGNMDWYDMGYGDFNINQFADVLNSDIDTLVKETIQYMDEEEDYKPSDAEVEEYIRGNDEYMDTLKNNYDEYVAPEFAQSFVDEAESIINEWTK